MKKFKTLFTVLCLGAVWGLLEATLGTLLHLDAFDSIMFASTAVLFPIAYVICGRAYKVTGQARSALYVGIVAAAIKAVCFFFVPAINKVINPMVAIILESSVMAVAFRVTKPSEICSVKSFVTFIVASTVIRSLYVGYSMATAVPFQSAYIADGIVNFSKIVEYVVTMNAISFVYAAIYMGIGKLLSKTVSKKSLGILEHFAYSPAFSIAMVVIALAVTIVL